MDPHVPIRRNPEAVYRSLRDGGGGVLLHLGSGQYHGLNQTGACLWELIDGSRTVAEISAEFHSRYDAPDGFTEIVETFCRKLRERDLVRIG
jgi:hypothetical protein